MSVQRDRFEQAARTGDWDTAFFNLNSLSMFEMLRTLDAVGPAIREQVRSKLGEYARSYGISRIGYAIAVVNNLVMPIYTPTDLRDSPAQIEDARAFIEEKTKTQGASVSRAMKLIFKTMDEAGMAAIRDINPTSIKENIEYSGAIYTVGVVFGFTVPKRGELTASDKDVAVPFGATRVALYHTHGGPSPEPKSQGGREIYSFNDRGIHNHYQLFGYLGTPSGAIKKFFPKPPAPDETPTLWSLGGRVVEL